jgi:hypothetical protein
MTMRNIRAERTINKLLTTRFLLDEARFDVTVLEDTAEITGRMIDRRSQDKIPEAKYKEIQHFFRISTVDGVRTYVFRAT